MLLPFWSFLKKTSSLLSAHRTLILQSSSSSLDHFISICQRKYKSLSAKKCASHTYTSFSFHLVALFYCSSSCIFLYIYEKISTTSDDVSAFNSLTKVNRNGKEKNSPKLDMVFFLLNLFICFILFDTCCKSLVHRVYKFICLDNVLPHHQLARYSLSHWWTFFSLLHFIMMMMMILFTSTNLPHTYSDDFYLSTYHYGFTINDTFKF